MSGSPKVVAEEHGWPPAMDGFPDRLKLALKRIKMPQSHLAELANVDQGTLSKIINGKREGATIRFLTSLADHLKVKPGWLLFGEGPLPEAPPPERGRTDQRKRDPNKA